METKKLTAKDLMIGDWVLCVDSTHKNKTYAQIDAIEEGQRSILLRKENTNWFLLIGVIEPIPLTAEVLEKNGWTKPASGRVWSRNNVPSFVLEEIDDGSFEVTTDTCSEWGGLCMIRHVHQLQHLLRICHVEKEVVL